MKKVLLLCFLSSIVCCASANTGDKFIDALRNCSSFSDSGTININGIDAKSEKQMLGWQGDKCVYKESLNYNGNNILTVCKFSRTQVNEIVSTADAYFMSLRSSGHQPDLSSLESIQNNPVSNIMSRYLQDSSVCTMSVSE